MKYLRWIDDAKGFAITLIVLGHVVATFGNMTTGSAHNVMTWLFDAIYSFHVPLFFVLAGLTFPSSMSSNSFFSFIKKKFLRLMLPYYIWGGVSALLYIIIGQNVASAMQTSAVSGCFSERTLTDEWFTPLLSLVHAGGWPNGQGFRFNGVIWFLPMLFICEVAYYWLSRFLRGASGAFLIASICMALTANLTKFLYDIHLPFDITRVPLYLVFIAIGHGFSLTFIQKQPSAIDKYRNYGLSICLVLYVVIAMLLPISMSTEYAVYSISQIVIALPTIAVVLLASKMNILKCFGFLAPLSIGIMLFHKFPLVIGQLIIAKLKLLDCKLSCFSPDVFIVLFALLFAFTIIIGCWAISKFVARYMPLSLGIKRT